MFRVSIVEETFNELDTTLNRIFWAEEKDILISMSLGLWTINRGRRRSLRSISSVCQLSCYVQFS